MFLEGRYKKQAHLDRASGLYILRDRNCYTSDPMTMEKQGLQNYNLTGFLSSKPFLTLFDPILHCILIDVHLHHTHESTDISFRPISQHKYCYHNQGPTMLLLARRVIFSLNLGVLCKFVADRCVTCMRIKSSGVESPYDPDCGPANDVIFFVTAVDYVGPFKLQSGLPEYGNQCFIIIFTDQVTRYTNLVVVPDRSQKSFRTGLLRHHLAYGISRVYIVDKESAIRHLAPFDKALSMRNDLDMVVVHDVLFHFVSPMNHRSLSAENLVFRFKSLSGHLNMNSFILL